MRTRLLNSTIKKKPAGARARGVRGNQRKAKSGSGSVPCRIRPERQAEIARDSFVRNRTLMDVQAGSQVRILRECADALVGKRPHVRQRCIGERKGRRARHGAWHVRDTVVNDTVDYER